MIDIAGQAMAIESAFVAVCDADTTWTVKLAVPATVGVPVMLPTASIARPVGREPADTEKAYVPVPPVAATLAV